MKGLKDIRRQLSRLSGLSVSILKTPLLLIFSIAMSVVCCAQESEVAPEENLPSLVRQGYQVDVELPLIGDRDEQVRQQILRIAEAHSSDGPRPIVVLNFRPSAIAALSEPDVQANLRTRGSQFERCLALARFLTGSEAARVRLIAYLSQTVEGHAVLPVLACEEIISAPTAELGRAAIDEAVDLTVESAYRDVVRRRATMPEAAVIAMLDPTAEVYMLDLADGTSMVANRAETDALRKDGQILGEKTLWQGGGLASFSGAQMRANRWIAKVIDDEMQLARQLGVNGSLRSSQQLPREWRAVSVTIGQRLNATRINQIIRGLNEQRDKADINLVVFQFEQTQCNFSLASRLADFVADLNAKDCYTFAIVREPLSGPIGLAAVTCREVVLLEQSSLGPDVENSLNIQQSDDAQRQLDDLATRAGRPLALMSVLIDADVQVKEFIHQENGKRAVFANWQVAAQPDADQWLARQQVAGGEPVSNEVALEYRLVDSIQDTAATALGRLGLTEMPAELSTPWLDASIEMVLAQGWLPKLLLTIGFFALMAELGNPGLGVGGFLAAACFMGFFWIEGLNGNVEWLEILLFVGGLVALAIELFVVPGFGIFGIGGLLMLFVSVVLASQTFIFPANSAQLSEVASNLFWTACLALGGMIGLLFMHKQLERLPMLKWVTLQPDEDPEDRDYRESVSHREHLLGQQGLTTTRLNPSGKAQFGLEIVPVVGSGTLVEEGVPVRVVEVRGNLVIVEAC